MQTLPKIFKEGREPVTDSRPGRTIFPELYDLKDQGRCPFCKKHVPADSFRDELSCKEFKISGLCQSCQDDAFGNGDGND